MKAKKTQKISFEFNNDEIGTIKSVLQSAETQLNDAKVSQERQDMKMIKLMLKELDR